MKRHTITIAMSMLVPVALILSACVVAPLPASGSLPARVPVAQQASEAAMEVIDQFFEAYRTYDVEKMLALHTDDAVWTWIDPGKNFPKFGPEGRWVGTGKHEIRAMFEFDRGEAGFSGYLVWSEVAGDTVTATELWESDFARQIDVPLITRSTYKLRDGKIAEWLWTVSPESSKRFMTTVSVVEANKQLLVSINDEIWNQGKLDLVDERYAPNYVRHQYPAEIAGTEAFKQYLQALHTAFPDWNCTLECMLADGDQVASRWLCQGTQQGEWMGIPPTNKQFQFTSSIIHKIADGKVVEEWVDYDSLGFMQQLGFELAPAQQ